MVIAYVIAVLVGLAVGYFIGSSFSKSGRFNELYILTKENRRLKKELSKKTEQILYWEATPETTITK